MEHFYSQFGFEIVTGTEAGFFFQCDLLEQLLALEAFTGGYFLKDGVKINPLAPRCTLKLDNSSSPS
jgi:hypothetical protein